MRKIITLSGIIVLATVVVLWSRSAADRSEIVGRVEATEAVSTMSPFDLMVTHGKDLPVETAVDPF